MNLPVAQKMRMLEARDHAQDPRLFAELEMILKADQVVGVGAQIFLP